MSPPDYCGKYHSHHHTQWRKGACHFLWETENVKLICTRLASSAWQQLRWSYGVFKSWIPVAQHLFQCKRHVLHNYDISLLQQVIMILIRIAQLMKVQPLFSAGVPSCAYDIMHHSCIKFKYQVADVNKQIHIAFRGIKCVPGEYDQPHHEIISWYIQSDY